MVVHLKLLALLHQVCLGVPAQRINFLWLDIGSHINIMQLSIFVVEEVRQRNAWVTLDTRAVGQDPGVFLGGV